MARGSESTATDRIRLLARYLAYQRMAQKGLIEMAKEDHRAVEDQLSDFLGKLEGEKKAPGYILNYIKALRSFLDFHEIRLVRKFKVRHADATPTLNDERVPNKDELKSILCGASIRGRLVIAFLAFGGLRPEALGNYGGTDGLRLKDLPEVRIVGKAVTFAKLPTSVVVRPELSKAGPPVPHIPAVRGVRLPEGVLRGAPRLRREVRPREPRRRACRASRQAVGERRSPTARSSSPRGPPMESASADLAV